MIAIKPPEDATFGEADFMESEDLEELAQELIGTHAGFSFLGDWSLKVLWKRKGGRKGGKQTLGKCLLQSGLTGFFSRADWVIWLAADHLRGYEESGRVVEAVLYHELCHCVLDEDEQREVTIRPAVVGHDAEIFLAEIEEYGLWRPTLKAAATTFERQLRLLEDTATGTDQQGGSHGSEV